MMKIQNDSQILLHNGGDNVCDEIFGEGVKKPHLNNDKNHCKPKFFLLMLHFSLL